MIWTVIKTFFVRMIAGCILAAPSLDRFGTPVGILNGLFRLNWITHFWLNNLIQLFEAKRLDGEVKDPS